jgi:hypothetical protein
MLVRHRLWALPLRDGELNVVMVALGVTEMRTSSARTSVAFIAALPDRQPC